MKRIVLLTVLAMALMAPTSTEAISEHWKREVLLHRLTDTSGDPLDTTVSMIYTIYDDSIGGTVWWTETHPNVTVIGGLVSVLLGAVNPLEDSIFFQRQHLPYKRRWMGIKIGSDPEIRPRTLLTPVPMALCVGTIEGADGGTIIGALEVMDTTSTKSGESGRHGGSATLNVRAVNGASIHVYNANDDNVIDLDGGANGRATIGPGHTNTGTNAFVTGANNTATGNYSTIGGGHLNLASKGEATVGGGTSNTASGNESTVSGGHSNTASGNASTVGGGDWNVAAADTSVISGGQDNTIAASAQCGTIGGGYNNTVNGVFGTIGGGTNNTTNGDGATVPGGALNEANGLYSFAAGYGANAANAGCFVWNDGNVPNWTSTADNQFLIHAAGGVGIGTTDPAPFALNVVGKDRGIYAVATEGDNTQRPWAVQATLDRSTPAAYATTGGGVSVPIFTSMASNVDHLMGGYFNMYRDNLFPGRMRGVLIAMHDETDADRGLQVNVNAPAYAIYSEENGLIYFAGNVGIGTTGPTEELHVVGDICYTGNCGPCSDVRYKKNIQTIPNALDKVMSLRGVTYNWRRDEFPDLKFEGGTHIGFVAQEIKEILPGVVSQGNNGFYSVDYSRLTPILVEAVKEQQKTIDELKAHLHELQASKRAEIESLKAQMAQLQALVETILARQSGDNDELAISK